ncbi:MULTISPECIES: helix-turn-helix domain-containing protein [unclassified Gordonia (in: high G+C Gram-positive bacteria)]|uniref:helix-turn-helix domain-containing protein n=1 Tax=unclassified Gordonia (in: high G+C Gram-positive bacteria) TaxID=2657482 RepID=UPI001F115EFB|nr:helix-turn-helix domain-containing protein [Gordonia sp. ABSL49_1]MCH5643949.1 helix-turn-helix domain-containing protein [Gordonia sp. ABSL49_1]
MHDDENNSDQAQGDLTGAATSGDPAEGLAAVRALRTLADRLEDIHVANARSAGWSWQAIAEVLQISRQAVHQKHSQREARDRAEKE